MPLEGEYEPSSWDWVREQVEKYERSDGADAPNLLDTSYPVVVVTSRGVKTGKLRKNPVMRVEHEGKYAAIGSKGGDPKNPAWVENLRADPHVELQDGAQKWDMIAREVDGEERDEWWARGVAAYPDYEAYQSWTDRKIPVFVLERE
ncbi:MAG TPA: nitroreductase family deazaflavin-dependent oxidoreductase [Mycobacteriales bacterium]|nr:nitroreductase family deazaflavin-dependent oxidoreductase [Mycobacteriales bacterium]